MVLFNLWDAALQPTWPYSSTVISYAGHRRVIQLVSLPILLAKRTTEEAQENSDSLGLVFVAKSQLIFGAWSKELGLLCFILLQKFQCSSC